MHRFLLILDLWVISFHAVVVFGVGKDHLFKVALGHCVSLGSLALLSNAKVKVAS